MPVFEHVYDIPDEDELAQLVGAAAPHFAFQILARIHAYAELLPPDHPRQPELKAHIDHLIALGDGGETGGLERSDLPGRGSVANLGAPGHPGDQPITPKN